MSRGIGLVSLILFLGYFPAAYGRSTVGVLALVALGVLYVYTALEASADRRSREAVSSDWERGD